MLLQAYHDKTKVPKCGNKKSVFSAPLGTIFIRRKNLALNYYAAVLLVRKNAFTSGLSMINSMQLRWCRLVLWLAGGGWLSWGWGSSAPRPPREKDKCLVVITPAVSTLTSPVLCSICLCGSDLRAAIGCSMSKAEKRLVLWRPEF